MFQKFQIEQKEKNKKEEKIQKQKEINRIIKEELKNNKKK